MADEFDVLDEDVGGPVRYDVSPMLSFSCSFEVREAEHRRDIVANQSTNAFVQHIERVGHLPRWTDSKVVAEGLPRHKRKMVETALITNERLVTYVMSCSYRLSKVTAALVAAEVTRV